MIARRYNTQDCLVAVDLAWPRSDLHTHFKQKNPLDGSGHYIWWGNAAFIAWNKLCNLIWTSSVRLGRFYCGLTKCVYVMDLRAVRCQGNARNVDVSHKVLHTRAFNGKDSYFFTLLRRDYATLKWIVCLFKCICWPLFVLWFERFFFEDGIKIK